MKTTRSTEVAESKKQDLERARRMRAAVKVNKNWLKSMGMLKDSQFARDACALGEEWRHSQVDPQSPAACRRRGALQIRGKA